MKTAGHVAVVAQVPDQRRPVMPQLDQGTIEVVPVGERFDARRDPLVEHVAGLGELRVEQHHRGRMRRFLLERRHDAVEIHDVAFVQEVLPAVVARQAPAKDEQKPAVGDRSIPPPHVEPSQQEQEVKRQQEQQPRPHEGERHPPGRPQECDRSHQEK